MATLNHSNILMFSFCGCGSCSFELRRNFFDIRSSQNGLLQHSIYSRSSLDLEFFKDNFAFNLILAKSNNSKKNT